MQHNKNFYLIRGRGTVSKTFETDLSQYTHCCVLTASVPKTYFTLPNDAVLTLSENAVESALTFTAGNYNTNSLRLLLSTALNTASYTYAVSFPNIYTEVDTGKYTITVSDNAAVQPTITTSDKYLAQMIGFDVDTVYTFVVDKLTSADTVNFQAYDEIILKSNIVDNDDDLLQEIYSAGYRYGSSILYECQGLDMHSKKIRSFKGSKGTFKFYLVDSLGAEISLNGNDWSAVILFYRADNTTDIIKRYIKLELQKSLANLET